MKDVKAPTSSSYQSYLISRLKEPVYAATYLETYLEDATLEPEALQLALFNVAEALTEPPEQVNRQQVLKQLLTQSGDVAIPALVDWLSQLGLKLTVVAATANGAEANDSFA